VVQPAEADVAVQISVPGARPVCHMTQPSVEITRMLELLWPSVCAGCGIEGEGLVCPRCAPAVAHRPPVHIEGISGVFACSGYGAGAGKALRRGKYGRQRLIITALSAGFATALAPHLVHRFDAVVPAPSPWNTRIKRGFDSAAILAHALATALRLPVRDVLRARPGPRQASLDLVGRRKSASSRIRGDVPISGRLLLVDDVVTTGATAEACARELLGSGAAEVWLATLCATRRVRDVPNSMTMSDLGSGLLART
jgi:predicted amidophosphoribosyltransferase